MTCAVSVGSVRKAGDESYLTCRVMSHSVVRDMSFDANLIAKQATM